MSIDSSNFSFRKLLYADGFKMTEFIPFPLPKGTTLLSSGLPSSVTRKHILRPQFKMAAFPLKISTGGGGAQPFSQTTGNLKMELTGEIMRYVHHKGVHFRISLR
jgi:hypothetical protein